jgi:tetratricopeptide (TPR) repeat protein
VPEIRRCEQCGRPLPAGQDECPECSPRTSPIGSFPREGLIALIVVVLVLAFFAAGRATRAFHAEERDLAETWFKRGESDLQSKQPDAAIDAYRTALRYSPGNALFELRLAEALISGKRTVEARSYLLALWERDPQSGPVNYELGRLSAEEGNVSDVIRYYHNAIYGEWDSPDENRRRSLRLEIYRYLRARGAAEQAEAELMALAGEAPHDATAHAEIGELLLRDGDDDHALKQFQSASEINPRLEAALAGAGIALFQMGRYAEAQHFLNRAVATNPRDAKARAIAETVTLVLTLDPFDPRLRVQEKSGRTARAFESAMERLKDCAEELTARPAAGELQNLETEGQKLARQASPRQLARNPDAIVSVMDFVFRAESAATKACGPATGGDRALEIIGERHGGTS